MPKLSKKFAYYAWEKGMPISHAITNELDGRDYGVGEIEAMRAQLEKVTTMLACLVEKLEARGTIQLRDVLGMMNGGWEVAIDE